MSIQFKLPSPLVRVAKSFPLCLAVCVVGIPAPALANQDARVELNQLILNTEDYKNKRISFEGPFKGFTRNAPVILERSNFDEKKDVIILVGGPQIPVVAKQKDVEDVLLTLRKGSIVRVEGKLRQARVDPKHPATSGYFLEMESFEVIRKAPEGPEPGSDFPRRPSRPGPRGPREPAAKQ